MPNHSRYALIISASPNSRPVPPPIPQNSLSSPHAAYPNPESTPIIITDIIISRETELDKRLYSWRYVKQVFDYFNQNKTGTFLNHSHVKSFIRYLEKASNNSIQYIRACPQDPNCNPEKRLKEELSFLAQIMTFLNQQINKNNNPEKRSFAEASLRLQGKEIKNLIFDLAEQTRMGQFSNLTQHAQQRIVGEFFTRLPEDCLNIIYGLVPHKITSSTVTSTSSSVQKIITSPPPTSEQTISVTTDSPLHTNSTFQHTSPSSRFFSTQDSIILNSTLITTANSSAGAMNTTISTPNLDLDFSASSLISWKSGLASTGSGITAATVNKLVEQSLAALASQVSAGNLKKLEYLIALLQAIVTSCSIYLTQYSVDSIDGESLCS